jgi:tryptophan-rich sensory protein
MHAISWPLSISLPTFLVRRFAHHSNTIIHPPTTDLFSMWDIYFFVLNFKYLIHPQQNTHQTQLKKKNSLWTLLLLLLFFYQIFFFCFKKHCTRFF